jgi:hypothetical protein
MTASRERGCRGSPESSRDRRCTAVGASAPVGMAVGTDIPPVPPALVPAIRVWTEVGAGATWRRRPRVGTRRGGGRESVVCAQASQCGCVVRPANGIGSRLRWRCGGIGEAGARALGHPHWSMRHSQRRASRTSGEKNRSDPRAKLPHLRWRNEGILPGFAGCRISRRLEVHGCKFYINRCFHFPCEYWHVESTRAVH